MAFTDDPTLARDRVRMLIGDTDPDMALVSDGWYDYYLTEKNNNEKATAIEVAKRILALYANSASRERVDQVERYGKEQFDSYLEWLNDLLTNPATGIMSAPVPYLGGSSVSDMRANDANPDNVRPVIARDCDLHSTIEDPMRLTC